MVCLVAAGDGIIGELHVIKWPIAKILVIPRDESWTSEVVEDNQVPTNANEMKNLNLRYRNATRKTQPNSRAKTSKTKTEEYGEVLLRYQHTPAVVANRTILVYTQPRTRGMCSVLNFWPTSKPPPKPQFNENIL